MSNVDPKLQLISKIEELHGKVTQEENAVRVDLHGLEGRGAIAELLLPLPNSIPATKSLNISSTEVNDGLLKHLETLVHLENLDLRDTTITDKAAPVLVKLKGLKKLDLSRTNITDVGVRALKGLPGLTSLTLPTAISMDALVELKAALPDIGWIIQN